MNFYTDYSFIIIITFIKNFGLKEKSVIATQLFDAEVANRKFLNYYLLTILKALVATKRVQPQTFHSSLADG